MPIISVMSVQRTQKLKFVLDHVPPGFLVDARWLAAHGVTTSSVYDYQQRGWLEHVARGVYRRPFATSETKNATEWKVAVLSAQWIMGHDFHVGATTALGLQGHSHYLSLGREPHVYLFGNVPTWLPKLSLNATIRARRRQLFGSTMLGVENSDFNPSGADTTSPWSWPLKVSTPERAILEALNELPEQESFDTLDKIFEGLANLRPRGLMELLTACKSVKVKRLFFLFADRYNHAWLPRLDRAAIDFGSGPRSLVEGGKLNSAYQLMVPPEFAQAPKREPSDGA